MLFISVEDFLTQASAVPCLSRVEEEDLVLRVTFGDETARETLVYSHLPLVAAHIRRVPWEIYTLHTVYTCIATVEKSVDSFNILQGRKAFARHLGWALRQCIVRCIADRF